MAKKKGLSFAKWITSLSKCWHASLQYNNGDVKRSYILHRDTHYNIRLDLLHNIFYLIYFCMQKIGLN